MLSDDVDVGAQFESAVEGLPARQRDVLQQIILLTDTHGYPPTLAELALALGLKNRMTVHQHVAALKKKGFVHWEPGLNRSLKVVGALQELAQQQKLRDSEEERTNNVRRMGLPLAGTIAAGQPIDAMETTEYLEIDSRYSDEGCYALRVKGESMIDDGIFDGDFAIIKPNPSPRNGEIVVALLEDGSATLKRFFKEKSGYRLQPGNKDMEPILIAGGQPPNIQGVVVGLFRKM